MRITNGTALYPDGSLRPADLSVEGGRIAALTAPAGHHGDFDASDCYVTPGLVDIHVHGVMGDDTCDGTPNALDTMRAYLGAQGVTSFLGTTMALSETILAPVLSTIRDKVGKEGGGAVLRGVNLEGPFFNIEKKGAQNPDYIRDPDWDMFLRLWELSGHSIRLLDVAPELPGALPFIEKAAQLCTVSVAHTCADYSEAEAAFQHGASHVTHLFNAMPPFSHRAPGVVGAAAEYAKHAELIADGVHLHPSVIRNAFRWFGRERICLISDSMRACGMPDGEYDLGGQQVSVRSGRATLADGTIAGSSTNLAECMRRAVSFGIPAGDAFMAATANPAQAVGLSGELGFLKPGYRGDVVVWDKLTLQPRLILVGGKQI
ncbi:MAG: N-acetylglucosamine-6-phosphate deacetylase [Clostridia bacterium]|nr:N-acetylglucosamine-6-phosphate deacetylase [Clostridia bacterium]